MDPRRLPRRRVRPTLTRRCPTIVFHGDGDAVVHPGNGTQAIAMALSDAKQGDASSATAPVMTQGVSAQGRRYTRTVYLTAAEQPPQAEHWVVHGGGARLVGREYARFLHRPERPRCHTRDVALLQPPRQIGFLIMGKNTSPHALHMAVRAGPAAGPAVRPRLDRRNPCGAAN